MPSGKEIVVQLRGVTVRYGRRRALGPLSLVLHRGDFLGVVGPNGAGKSTLLRVVAGQQTVASGTIRRVNEWTAAKSAYPGKRLRRQAVGFLFQRHDFAPDLPFSVEDVVGFGRVDPGLFHFRSSRMDRAAIDTAIGDLGLSDMRRRLYRELSGGERQKVQFARLLAQEARIVLLDEPAAGLDLDAQEKVTALAQELCRTFGKTVIMVTHDIDRLPACTNNILLLCRGHAVAQGPPEKVLTPDLLSGVYGCSIDVLVRGTRFHAFAVGSGTTGEGKSGDIS